MNTLMSQINELNETFDELGEDLVLLEALAIAVHMGHPFPEDFLNSGLDRMTDYIHQHLTDVKNLSREVCKRTRLPQEVGIPDYHMKTAAEDRQSGRQQV